MQERRYERTQVTDPDADGVAETRTDRVRETPRGQRVTSAPYEESYERTVAPPAATAVDQVNTTAYDPYAERRQGSNRLVQMIWLLFGIVVGLLAIRFILKLLGANEAAGFSNFINAATGPFVAPFNNLFENLSSGGGVLELNTIVAIIVYMLLAWLIAKLIWLLTGESRSATRSVASTTRANVDERAIR